MKKVFWVLGTLVALFILFVWWGSTVETPDTVTEDGGSTVVSDEPLYTNQNFTSDKGNFSIYFEGTPLYKPNTLTLKTGDTTPTHLYQYESPEDGSVWQAFYTEYPSKIDVSNPENFLLNTVRGTEGSVGGKITSTKTTVYQGFPAIDYTIYLAQEKVYMKGRNILSGYKFYSVAYIHDEGKEVDTSPFFDSLKINK